MSSARDPARELAVTVARAGGRPGASRTLLLDLDGTLAPMAPTPGDAIVPRDTLAALRDLLGGSWTVAIVSGRPVGEVRRLVPLRGVRAFGSHGLEGSWDGRTRARPARALLRRLELLTNAARTLARHAPGAYLETKPAGIALHDRNVDRGDLGSWRRSVRELLRTSDLEGFEVLRGRRVIEVRPWGQNKGRVVRDLLRQRPASRDASLVAVGDDRTDEDMFRELRGAGLAVRVGRPGVKTLARLRLPSPAAVRRFLMQLAERSPRRRRPW